MTAARRALLALGMATTLARSAGAQPARPRLVVLVMVDQMRADYLEQYGAAWKGGLRRLMDEGAWMVDARLPYAETFTCPGHATAATGTYPHIHGMVLNKWYDAARGATIECTDDPGVTAVVHVPPAGDARPPSGESARNLLALTLADQMKAHLTPAPRVVSLSLKARAAIDLAGHKPDVAVWFDGGRWVSSTAFTLRPLPWVETFVRAHPPAAGATTWTRLRPAGTYLNSDDAPEERPRLGWGRTFPHPIAGPPVTKLERWLSSPLSDAYLVELALAGVSALKLGQGPSTDFLALGLSSTDLVGHTFGPRSHEVQDALARVDLALGKLLAALDAKVGRGRYVLALASDHGTSDIPETGHEGGRVPAAEVRAGVERALAGELGPGAHLAALVENDVYLSPAARDALAARAGALDRVRAAIRALPGVAEVLDGHTLRNPAQAGDPVRRAAALSYFPGRSGDLIMVRRRGWLFGDLASNHGTGHDYDQRVPLLFFGAPFKAGRRPGPASPADIAPTLGALIGVQLPRAEGEVRREILAAP